MGLNDFIDLDETMEDRDSVRGDESLDPSIEVLNGAGL